MTRFFTADPHYYHDNIIKFCNRPFKNVYHMHKVLFNNWNKVVRNEDDEVIIVGDFSLRGPKYAESFKSIFDRLKGRKTLVLGNHDVLKPYSYLRAGVESVHTSLILESDRFFIAHDPSLANCAPDGYVTVCGHVHNVFKYLTGDHPVINVGVDIWDFTPVSETQIRDLILKEKLR